MFNQREEGFSGTTIIAEGVRVEGNFKGDGPMVIDGIVKGTVTTSRSIEIGKAASIEANIKADAVVVGGFVKGNITAKARVELLAGSTVEGDVVTRTLVIAEGATLNGKCTMGGEADRAPVGNPAEEAERGIRPKETTKGKLANKVHA